MTFRRRRAHNFTIESQWQKNMFWSKYPIFERIWCQFKKKTESVKIETTECRIQNVVIF